jgi:hypothetical protein
VQAANIGLQRREDRGSNRVSTVVSSKPRNPLYKIRRFNCSHNPSTALNNSLGVARRYFSIGHRGTMAADTWTESQLSSMGIAETAPTVLVAGDGTNAR